MVNFSLKLEDNRVDKWSAHYLDYRKLKQAIKQLVASRNAANAKARRCAHELYETCTGWFLCKQYTWT